MIGLLLILNSLLLPEGILVHKASFGDQLPKPGTKSQAWEPGEDILFGSMSFSNLQTNVAKLGTRKPEVTGHEQKVEKSLDEKLQMLKSDGKVETNGQEIEEKKLIEETEQLLNISDTQISAMLPDVVQNHNANISLERKKETVFEHKNYENVERSTSQLEDILGSLDQLKSDSKTSGTSSPMSIGSSKGSKPSSVTASPAHTSRETSASPKPEVLSSSLAELQDPMKFTIGTSDGKKKKITKADFEVENRAPREQDPNDPLSSLDPFWSVK